MLPVFRLKHLHHPRGCKRLARLARGAQQHWERLWAPRGEPSRGFPRKAPLVSLRGPGDPKPRVAGARGPPASWPGSLTAHRGQGGPPALAPPAPSLPKEEATHEPTQSRARAKGPGGRGQRNLWPPGFLALLKAQVLKQLNPLLSSAFLSPAADLYRHPQGKTILFPQQNRLCTSGLGINHQPQGWEPIKKAEMGD